MHGMTAESIGEAVAALAPELVSSFGRLGVRTSSWMNLTSSGASADTASPILSAAIWFIVVERERGLQAGRSVRSAGRTRA